MRRSSEISALNIREPKAWKVIDQHLSLKKNIPPKVRQSAAEFVLKRLYPEKQVLEGNVTHEHFFRNVIRKSREGKFNR